MPASRAGSPTPSADPQRRELPGPVPHRPGPPERLDARSDFRQAIAREPETGVFTTVSQVDGIERRVGYRHIPGYPVYVQAGIETAAMRRELRDTLLGYLAFGLPATLALCALSVHALTPDPALPGRSGPT